MQTWINDGIGMSIRRRRSTDPSHRAVFFGATLRNWLVAVGIEAGRITHSHPIGDGGILRTPPAGCPHPTGFLGSLAAAAFTAFAMEDRPVIEWGRQFMSEILPLATEYLQTTRCIHPLCDPFYPFFPTGIGQKSNRQCCRSLRNSIRTYDCGASAMQMGPRCGRNNLA